MPASAVVYVSDLDRMVAFYARCFDLAAGDRTAQYGVLESDAWSLMLVRSAEAAPTTSPPSVRTATAIKLAFEVADLDAIRELVTALGGRFDAGHAVWSFGHASRCDCIDPEGNVVQLIQPHAPA